MISEVSYSNGERGIIVGPPQRPDLPGILRVEWKAFPGVYEYRFTPKSLLEWFTRKPHVFRVAKDDNGDVVGYSNLIPLSQRGFDRLRRGCWHALTDISEEDIADGPGDQPVAYHIDLIATLYQDDIWTGALLLKDLARQIDPSIRWLSASAVTLAGQKLLEKATFECVWRSNDRLSSGFRLCGYVLDLQSDVGVAARRALYYAHKNLGSHKT